jgi:hypothetical protein
MKTETVNFDKELLEPQRWKTALLSEGYSQFQLMIDPTGMTQKLKAYQKVINSGPSSLFKTLRTLNEISECALKFESTLKVNQVALKNYVGGIHLASSKATSALRNKGYDDILAGKDPKQARELRRHAKSQYNEDMLDFILEVAEFQKKVLKGGSSYNDQVNGQDEILEKYEVRKDDGKLNFPAKERKAWVNAWDDTKDWQGLDQSMKCMEKCRQSIWASLFIGSFQLYCNEEKKRSKGF